MYRKQMLAALAAGALALGAVACEADEDMIEDPLENGNGIEEDFDNGLDDGVDDGVQDDGLEDDGVDDDGVGNDLDDDTDL